AVGKVAFPPGYRFAVSGQAEAQAESFGGILPAVLVAIFGILAVLVLEFGSFRSTLIVAGVVPLGITGALLALLITGNTLSFTAIIGMIALVGIEIKNSILLVDFTNQLREEGVPLQEAIEKAVEVRFLPILLTSATAIGGLLPLAGACPLAPMFDTVGWFARDAHMLARVGTVLCDAAGVAPEEHDVRPARVLVAQDALALVVPESRPMLEEAVQRVASQLASQASVETVTLAPEGLRAWYDVFRVLQWADIWRTHGAWVERVRPTFGPQIAPRFEAASRVTADELRDADQARLHIVARLDSLLAGDTVLVLPTVPDVAPRLALPPAETVAVREQALQLLCSAGLGGLPQISMPMAERDGLPMGVSLLAGRGRDRWLLELAASLR
ncbi:MAG: efflux RND transporter permease subunit, partial [Gemmatimonadaceae bacterium]|nr:efflux RND transporter permease subunit [Gemmatimonadaceae bacterium]